MHTNCDALWFSTNSNVVLCYTVLFTLYMCSIGNIIKKHTIFFVTQFYFMKLDFVDSYFLNL